jgi:2,4-dienoyl-CoA reductase-like NADH-dependent reductase (Old Yellow Enzyme family)/thioredoxin reductase
MNRKLGNLFSPIRVGTLELKNRIVMAPMGTNLASPEGRVTDKLIAHYKARAQGGVGLIITEDTTIGPNYIHNTLSLADDQFIPGWHDLVKTVQAHGTKIMPQLIHPAFNAPAARNEGTQPVSASPIPSRMLRELPRELNKIEIKDIVTRFGEAAGRAKEAGCDGLQIHCAHMHHLLGSFLSSYYNKRSDEYGGTLEGRLRLPIEVIKEIRTKIGPDFPLIIRISGDEYLPGGRTIEESIFIAPILVDSGLDAIHISAGTSLMTWIGIPPTGSPQAPNAQLSAKIKEVVDVPVICVGRITEPWAAETVIATGKADMVALARSLLADPDWPNKAKSGNWEDIAPCVGDTACLTKAAFGTNIACGINPSVGRDIEMDIKPAIDLKNVLVVGGGPGGMEAAKVAALRGHRVTLFEKESKLGGQLLMASFPPKKHEYTAAIRYFVRQMKKAGVNVLLNQEVTLATITDNKPDVVIIATGGGPLIPADISGVDQENVITAWQVLKGQIFPGPNIVVIGGGKVGCETANYLAHIVNDMNPKGNKVTILEMAENIVLDDVTPWRSVLIQELLSKGVKIITAAKVVEILPDGVKYLKKGKKRSINGMDHIVLSIGTKPENELAETLESISVPYFIIGDAKNIGTLEEATSQGRAIGLRI